MTLNELIQSVPKETEKRVEKTRQRLNGVVRAILRDEMALRLSLPSSEGTDSTSREAVTVPVKVVAGVPVIEGKPILVQVIDFDSVLLGQQRGDLEDFARSIKAVRRLVDSLGRSESPLADSSPIEAIDRCNTWVTDLLNRLEKADPLPRILDFREDVLGRYHYHVPIFIERMRRWSSDPFRGEIELYWGVIGLVAELLNSTPEDVTVVTLAHELAHAYTHIGADIDGARWASLAFAGSDVCLKEGLAQYYTWRVCERLKDRVPNALKTFTDLLRCQPAPYHTQQGWIDEHSSPEHVRRAMLETRRHGEAVDSAQFSETLAEARISLGPSPQSE